MIRGIKFSRLVCVMSIVSACGAPDAQSSRTPVVGQNQGADDTDCNSSTGQNSAAELLDTKVVSTKDTNQSADSDNCLPRKKPAVASGNKSGTLGPANGNPQVAANGIPASSNSASNNSNGSPFSDNTSSGGLGGLGGLANGLGGLGGLGGLAGGLGGLAGGLGGLGGLANGLGGLGGLGGLAGGLGGLSGLTSGLGGLGNFGNLGSLFGGGQSGAGSGSTNNSATTNNSNAPTTVSGSVTYSANVSPYLNRACVRCHSNLGNYDGAKRTASDSLNRMKSGNMPPGGGVSSSDLSQFQAWVTGGTPQ